MKNTSFLALLLLLLSSPIFAQPVSPSEAANLAKGFFQQKSGKRTQAMEQVHTASLRGGTPNYYLFEPSEGEGFILVAASKASVPVLGYSLSRSFPTGQIPPGMQFLLESYEKQLDYIKTNHIAATPQISAQWKNGGLSPAEDFNPVQPLLTTTWNQGWPYNLKCPKTSDSTSAITGCVATAMAQLMRYWNYPSQPIATNYICLTDNNPFDPNSNVSGTWCTMVGGGYNWSLIQDNYNGISSIESRNQVAELMYDCGIGAQMDYGTDVSNATANAAAYAMDNWFGYSDCPVYEKALFNSDWKSILKNNLYAGHPMYYGGDNRPAGDEGHAWVVDGYDGGDGFHMNWGWGGMSNDYFVLTDLTPQAFVLTNHQHMFVPVPQGLCPVNATPGGDQSNAQVEVARWIHSNATVYSGGTTAFNAGHEITLTDGFVAYAGADFHAFIQGCDGYFTDPGSDDRSQPVEKTVLSENAAEVKVAPNPFLTSTTITYNLLEAQPVAIQLFSLTGQLMLTPLPAQTQSAGPYEQVLDLAAFPAGMYLLVVRTGGQTSTQRIVRM